MVRQNTKSSRVTPKGTKSEVSVTDDVVMVKSSPWYVPAIMFGSFFVGVGIIIANYLAEIDALGMPSNWYLLVGLALVLVGITSSTRLR